MVWASTPVNTNVVMLTPPGSPKPASRAGPRTRTRTSGNVISETSRSRSRSSFTKSRWAITAIADSSARGPRVRGRRSATGASRSRGTVRSAIAVTLAGRASQRVGAELGSADDLEVCVLERRRVGADERQRGLDRAQDAVDVRCSDIDPERPVAGGLEVQSHELGPEGVSVGGVDQQVLVRERGRELRRRPG